MAKTPLKAASGSVSVSVSFEPAGMTYDLPENTYRDSGELFGAKPGGQEYGWTTCKHGDFTERTLGRPNDVISMTTTAAKNLNMHCKDGEAVSGGGCSMITGLQAQSQTQAAAGTSGR